MRNMLFAAVAAASLVATPALAQQTTTTTVNSGPVGGTATTSGFTYGDGNDYLPANAVDTRTTLDLDGTVTSDLATRFHVTGLPASPSDSSGLYTFALGTNVSFDYSLFGDFTDANITLTNLLTGQTASFNPLLIPDNSTSTAGAIQNSEQLGFGFLNGGFPPFGDLGFDANVNDTYRLDLSAGGHTATAFAQLGSGAPAVPEPATWAMMLAGFGAAGLALRRRLRPQRREANAA